MYHRPQLCRRGKGDGKPEEDGEGGEGVVGTRYKRAPARENHKVFEFVGHLQVLK